MSRQRICGNFSNDYISGMLAIPSFVMTSVAAPLAAWGRDSSTARYILIALLVPAGLLFASGSIILLGPSDGTSSFYEYVLLLPAPIILAGLLLPRR